MNKGFLSVLAVIGFGTVIVPGAFAAPTVDVDRRVENRGLVRLIEREAPKTSGESRELSRQIDRDYLEMVMVPLWALKPGSQDNPKEPRDPVKPRPSLVPRPRVDRDPVRSRPIFRDWLKANPSVGPEPRTRP